MLKIVVSKRVKIINFILFFLLLLFAIVQLNDPDPFLWVFIYLTASILVFLSVFKNIPKIILRIVLIGLLLFAGFYISYFLDWLKVEKKEELFGKMIYDKPYLEGTREFLGLLLTSGIIYYLLRQKK